MYYDLRAEREKRGDRRTAIVRVEQLYPFPAETLAAVLSSYSAAREVLWTQEEPRNMGAWSFVQPILAGLLARGPGLRYVGRVASASPATGNASVHKKELETLLTEAFSGA